MTLDEALDRAAVLLDAHHRRQCDANFLRAVETGATAADLAALDEWQQDEYAARRPTVLAELRAALIREAQESR